MFALLTLFFRQFLTVLRLRRVFLVASRALVALILFGGLNASWAATSTVTTPQIKAELLAHAPNGLQNGQVFWLGLQLEHAPQWHTYWSNPGDAGLATEMSWRLPAGLELGEVLWPLPHQLKASTLTNYGFEGKVLLAVPVRVTSAFKPGIQDQIKIEMHANWLVCRQECMPQEGDFSFNLPIRSSTVMAADAFDQLLNAQPQTLTHAKVNGQVELLQGHGVLKLSVQGLPQDIGGQALEVFALEPEVLASTSLSDARAHQQWGDEIWQAVLPLHKLRDHSPKSMKLLVVSSQPQRKGWWIEAPISGNWPTAAETSNTEEIVFPPPSPAPLGALTFLGAMASALLGGLILNLMPCVLPVLAIKVLHFAQHHETPRQRHAQGLAYTLGVVLSFTLLGGVLLILRASGQELGWGFQLQSPGFVMALAVLFTLIALSLFGLLEVGHWLPDAWMSYQSHHPVINAGVSGVLAVVVASPCTAPFMGASLGLAMTLPSGLALAIFASMGLGLALPYALVSAWPHLSRYLPQPGAWMVLLRQFFGFPMLATVVWLVWVLALQTDLQTSLLLWMGLLCLSAAIWAQRLTHAWGRVVCGLIWLGAVGLLWQAASSLNTLESNLDQTPPVTASTAAARWQAWSESSVQAALAQQHPVFVDFTAAWCVTCQINKRAVLSNETVLKAFEQRQVTLMRADWTRRDPQITRALNALGRSGVPVYVLYRPQKPPVVLSELLSQSDVLHMLEDAP